MFVKTRKGFLVHAVGGVVYTNTACGRSGVDTRVNHYSANRIFAELFSKLDPFVHQGEVVTARGDGWVSTSLRYKEAA